MKAIIIINENHSMMDEQKSIIEERYQKYEVLKVPSQGWDIDEMLDQINKLHIKACEEKNDIIFISPIPLMIRELTEMSICPKSNAKKRYGVKLFHNDRREKKELPDGRIISVVAQTGWQLV